MCPLILSVTELEWQNEKEDKCIVWQISIAVFTLWTWAAVWRFNHQRALFTGITSVVIMVYTALQGFTGALHDGQLETTSCTGPSGLPLPQAAGWTRWGRQRSSAWWDTRAHGPWEPLSAGAAPQTENPPEDKSTSRERSSLFIDEDLICTFTVQIKSTLV